MSAMRDVAKLQEDYIALFDAKRVTKKAICDLCIPFRDKYGLTDLQTLRIAQDKMDLSEMVELLERGDEG